MIFNSTPWFKRALPFATYMLFLLIHELLKPILPKEVTAVYLTPILYTAKILSVALVLALFWKSYDELCFEAFQAKHLFTALTIGGLVFVFWIHMDWSFLALGTPDVYNPNQLPKKLLYAFLLTRLLGTSLVVPIFEELFWRSFILRYIINSDFTSVRIGTFSWPSFFLSSFLFGLEHHFWIAGIMAGVLYNLLLYRTKNLCYCILAHGMTNLLLGIYVLKTGNWHFW